MAEVIKRLEAINTDKVTSPSGIPTPLHHCAGMTNLVRMCQVSHSDRPVLVSNMSALTFVDYVAID